MPVLPTMPTVQYLLTMSTKPTMFTMPTKPTMLTIVTNVTTQARRHRGAFWGHASQITACAVVPPKRGLRPKIK